MEPVFSDWMTGTLSDEGWGPRDDKIVQFASHYFLYFPIFHLKYSYILSFRIPIFLFFCHKVTGHPGCLLTTSISWTLMSDDRHGCGYHGMWFLGRLQDRYYLKHNEGGGKLRGARLRGGNLRGSVLGWLSLVMGSQVTSHFTQRQLTWRWSQVVSWPSGCRQRKGKSQL